MLVFEIFATFVLLLKGTAKGEMDLVQDSTGIDLCSQLFHVVRTCILKNEQLIIQCQSLLDNQIGSFPSKTSDNKTDGKAHVKHHEMTPRKRKISAILSRSAATKRHTGRYGSTNQTARNDPPFFLFDIGKGRFYRCDDRHRICKQTWKPEDREPLVDITYSQTDHRMKWISNVHVDSCPVLTAGACTREKGVRMPRGLLISARYDPIEDIYYYMTKNRVYRFDAVSRRLKALFGVSNPVLFELGYSKRPLFWTEYHAPYTTLRYISKEDSLTHVVYKTNGFIYGFGLLGTNVYICGNETMHYSFLTRKAKHLPLKYQRCLDMEYDGKGFYVLYKTRTLKYFLNGRPRTKWMLMNPIEKGRIRVVREMTKERTFRPRKDGREGF